MGIQVQGNGGAIAEVDGTTFRALRITSRPLDHGAFGHYKFSGVTGAIAAGMAANGELLQLRWVDASRLCVITHVHVDGMFTSTAFAVGSILLKCTIARSWSADGTGGNAATLTGNNNKARTNMGSSLFSTGFRLATTAALGAGTKTLDANDVGQIQSHSSAGPGAAAPIIGSTYLPRTDLFAPDASNAEHPIVLAQNEGIVIRATVPATGVWTLGVSVRWAEVLAY